MRTRVIIVVAVLLGAAVAVARADRYEEPPLRKSFTEFPMQLGEWQGIQNAPFTARVLEVLGLDDYVTRGYVRGRTGLDLYVGYWKSQRQGDTMHSPQNCLPAAGWEPVSQALLTFPDPRNPGAPPLTVNRYVIEKGLDRELVLYWYQGRGRVVGSEIWSKLYLMWDAAWLNRTDAAIIRVTVPLTSASPAAEAAAEKSALAFINELMPAMNQFLPN